MEAETGNYTQRRFNTVSVFNVKLLKVPMATPPVATKVSLGGPPHSGAGAACA